MLLIGNGVAYTSAGIFAPLGFMRDLIVPSRNSSQMSVVSDIRGFTRMARVCLADARRFESDKRRAVGTSFPARDPATYMEDVTDTRRHSDI